MLNKWVFSLDLNTERVSQLMTTGGREFQAPYYCCHDGVLSVLKLSKNTKSQPSIVKYYVPVLWMKPISYSRAFFLQNVGLLYRLIVNMSCCSLLSGTLFPQLRKVLLPSLGLLSRHIWKLNSYCSLQDTTRSNIFFTYRRLRFELSTHGATYKMFLTLTYSTLA